MSATHGIVQHMDVLRPKLFLQGFLHLLDVYALDSFLVPEIIRFQAGVKLDELKTAFVKTKRPGTWLPHALHLNRTTDLLEVGLRNPIVRIVSHAVGFFRVVQWATLKVPHGGHHGACMVVLSVMRF